MGLWGVFGPFQSRHGKNGRKKCLHSFLNRIADYLWNASLSGNKTLYDNLLYMCFRDFHLFQGQYYFWKTKFPLEGSQINVNTLTGILRSLHVIISPRQTNQERDANVLASMLTFYPLVVHQVILRTLFIIFQPHGTCLNNLLIPFYPVSVTFANCLSKCECCQTNVRMSG